MGDIGTWGNREDIRGTWGNREDVMGTWETTGMGVI